MSERFISGLAATVVLAVVVVVGAAMFYVPKAVAGIFSAIYFM